MKIIRLRPYSEFMTNSYIVTDGTNAVLIDAPGNNSEVYDVLESEGIRLDKILLTHGHCDHIAGAAELNEKTGAAVYIHSEDKQKLSNDAANLTEYFGLLPIEEITGEVVTVEDGDEIVSGDMRFTVMHTPGHTSGSVVYLIDDVMFSGDLFFAGSMGRIDMPDGNKIKMFMSLEKIKDIDYTAKDYKVYAGHGEETTLSKERISNPYLIF